MAIMAGGPAVEENQGESNVCMPSGFPEDVEPPPPSVADVERSQYKAAWRGESPGDPCYEIGESQLADSQTYILSTWASG